MTVKSYYDAYWSEHGFCPANPLVEPVRGILDGRVTPSTDCLDVGCGDGRTTQWLAQRARSYVGVDVSESAVRAARLRGMDARLVADAAVLPFADQSFDAVLCIEVLEHLFDPEAAAAEIRRVLRPGGTLVATVPNCAFWRRRVDLLMGRWNPFGDLDSVAKPWRDPHIRFFTQDALHRMLLAAGYSTAVVSGHAGGFVHSLPGLPAARRASETSVLYRSAERWRPSLLGLRLHALATR